MPDTISYTESDASADTFADRDADTGAYAAANKISYTVPHALSDSISNEVSYAVSDSVSNSVTAYSLCVDSVRQMGNVLKDVRRRSAVADKIHRDGAGARRRGVW